MWIGAGDESHRPLFFAGDFSDGAGVEPAPFVFLIR